MVVGMVTVGMIGMMGMVYIVYSPCTDDILEDCKISKEQCVLPSGDKRL